jgi:hypothetical protein
MMRFFLVLFLFSAAASPQTEYSVQRQTAEQIQRQAAEEIRHQEEMRKIDLEERRLYLATITGSKISEETARSLAAQLLQTLKDYPKGKKAPHFAEDTKLVIEMIASLSKDTSR